MKDKTLILASSSPRRRKILKELGFDFVVMPSDYNEVLFDREFSYEKINELAYNKGFFLLQHNPDLKNTVILSADTVVVIDNKILGKPKNEQEAFEMLSNLSGYTHFVVTSICAIDSNTKEKFIIPTTTYVTFNDLTKEQIKDYIVKFKPFDKAGAYGIQELPDGFIKDINGDYENVVGLSKCALLQALNKIKFCNNMNNC